MEGELEEEEEEEEKKKRQPIMSERGDRKFCCGRNLRIKLNTMSTSARRRLLRDFKKMSSDPPAGINAAPLEKCVFLRTKRSLNCVDTLLLLKSPLTDCNEQLPSYLFFLTVISLFGKLLYLDQMTLHGKEERLTYY